MVYCGSDIMSLRNCKEVESADKVRLVSCPHSQLMSTSLHYWSLLVFQVIGLTSDSSSENNSIPCHLWNIWGIWNLTFFKHIINRLNVYELIWVKYQYLLSAPLSVDVHPFHYLPSLTFPHYKLNTRLFAIGISVINLWNFFIFGKCHYDP